MAGAAGTDGSPVGNAAAGAAGTALRAASPGKAGG
jgi:hypothetical protein